MGVLILRLSIVFTSDNKSGRSIPIVGVLWQSNKIFSIVIEFFVPKSDDKISTWSFTWANFDDDSISVFRLIEYTFCLASLQQFTTVSK